MHRFDTLILKIICNYFKKINIERFKYFLYFKKLIKSYYLIKILNKMNIEELNMPVTKELKESMYLVYEGIDQYTGRCLTFKESQVDHIIPKRIPEFFLKQKLISQLDNIKNTLIYPNLEDIIEAQLQYIIRLPRNNLLNYILTSRYTNEQKGGGILNIVTLTYLLSIAEKNAPKILKKLNPNLINKSNDLLNENYEITLDNDKIAILLDIKKFPYISITERAIKLGYNAGTLEKQLTELVNKDFLIGKKISVGRGMGQPRIFKYTENAIKIFGRQQLYGITGSLNQAFCMHIISEVYKHRNTDYLVEIEKYIPEVNGYIDIAVSKDEERLTAIEIALSDVPEHECQNLEKCIKSNFKKIIYVATS